MNKIYTVIAATSLMLGLSLSAFAQNRSGHRSHALSGTPATNRTSTSNGHQSNDHGASANVQQRNDVAQRLQSGRKVIMANTEGDFHFAGPSGRAQSNGTFKTSGTRQRNNALEGDPDQPITTGSSANARQRNFVSALYSDALSATPAGGNYTFARSRGRQGH